MHRDGIAQGGWDERYGADGAIWGERPSALAALAAARLTASGLSLLDVGCGYGRDARFLAHALDCEVTGIDISEQAIIMARQGGGPTEADVPAPVFRVADFDEETLGEFDAVLASNLYHLLLVPERRRFAAAAARLVAPGGLLLLNALSVDDPEEYGKGEPVPGEPHSFMHAKYLHFFTKNELERDFEPWRTLELAEHAYDEPHAGGPTHHHVAWILVAQRHGEGGLRG